MLLTALALWGGRTVVTKEAGAFYRASNGEVSPVGGAILVDLNFMRFRRALALLALCSAAPAVAQAQGAKVIEGSYEITFAGFSGFRIDFTAHLDGDRYDVDSRAYKVGVMKGITMHYEGRNRAWGIFTPTAGARPSGGSLSLVISDKTRTWLAQYRAGGSIEETHTPPFHPEPKDIIPEDKKKGSLDPLTATIAASMAGDHACDRAVPSNDGQRRIDVILTKVRMERADTNEIPQARGDVLVCDIYTKRVAGLFYEPQNEAETERERPMRLWLARFDDTPFRYPAKLEAHTFFGTIRGRMLYFRER
jgi:hypothetical protein